MKKNTFKDGTELVGALNEGSNENSKPEIEQTNDHNYTLVDGFLTKPLVLEIQRLKSEKKQLKKELKCLKDQVSTLIKGSKTSNHGKKLTISLFSLLSLHLSITCK